MAEIQIDDELKEQVHTYGKILMENPNIGISFMSWHKARFRTAYTLNRFIEMFGRILVVFLPKDEDKAFKYPTHNVHLDIIVADSELTSWLTNFVAGELELDQQDYYLIAYQDPVEFVPGKKPKFTQIYIH